MATPLKESVKADLEQVLEATAFTEVRWALCLAVDKFGATGCNVHDLWLVADSMHCGLSSDEVKAMIQDLVRRGWFDLHGQQSEQPYVTPTENLGDLVNYRISSPVDIGRPNEKYWEG